jgi:uridylate kinase
MENELPLIVFNIGQKDNIRKIVLGEPIGTLVKEEPHGKGAVGSG